MEMDLHERLKAAKIVNAGGGGGGETFEVKMTLNSSGTAFTASKTLQETIDAIKAGKQIDFSLTHDGAESKVFCYGVADTSGSEFILMMTFDGTTLFSIYWVGDEDAALNLQIPMIIAGTNQ